MENILQGPAKPISILNEEKTQKITKTTYLSEKLNAISLEYNPVLSNLVKEIAESSKNPTYKELKEELPSIPQ